MKASRLWVVCIACFCAAGGLTAVAGASTAGHRASTRVTIYAWPRGFFGEVSSPRPSKCANNRRVVVFEQRGRHQNPRRDRRVVAARTKRAHGFYEWSVMIHQAGRFYAKAMRSSRCRAGFSKSVRFRTGAGNGNGGGSSSVPACNPYLAQGPYTICRFDGLHMVGEGCPSLEETESSCTGFADSGPFPWGVRANGTSPAAEFDWNWRQGRVLYVDYQNSRYEGPGIAHLGGTMPGPGSDAFTVEDGFAQDNRGYPNGLHFFTPDIPGQAAGEEGGPLSLRYTTHPPGGLVDVDIHGFLYLKR